MWLYEYMSDRAIITQAVCVLAIHIASKRSVPERIASLSLSPLPPATDADAAVTPAAQQEQVAWYRRLRFSPRKFGRAILPILILVAFEFFVLGILPRISSQMVYNGFFIALIAMVLGVTINNNFVFFFGGATKLVLFRKEKATLVKRLPADTSDRKFFAKQRNSMSAAAVLTAGVILLTSYDVNNYAIPFVVGAMVINTFNSITFNKLTTRGLTLVSMGLVALIFALIPIIGVIVLVCQNFIPEGDEGNDSVPSDSETAVAMLPNWILRLLVLQSDLMMAAPAMFLVAFALRYDHLGPSSALRLTASKAAPGEGVVVPQLIERRPTPTYKVAMASLIGTYLLIDVTVHTLLAHDILSFSDAKNVENARGATIMLASFILTNTVVPSALVLYAWSKGEARQWWTCVEIWAPTDEDTAQEASAGDVEKAENGAEREEGLLASENKALLA